ncbi:MAG: hypothetical protein CM1200mP39_24140 [Dehalococcoidia bacterium]|nr:MAG: hypothetical protein CM1200mP39_24140 [Dehalococcoidia bacterium]
MDRPRIDYVPNGGRIDSLSPVDELLNGSGGERPYKKAMVPEVLFIRDSLDSDLGVIISIQFQIKVDDTGGVEGKWRRDGNLRSHKK